MCEHTREKEYKRQEKKKMSKWSFSDDGIHKTREEETLKMVLFNLMMERNIALVWQFVLAGCQIMSGIDKEI